MGEPLCESCGRQNFLVECSGKTGGKLTIAHSAVHNSRARRQHRAAVPQPSCVPRVWL